MNLQVSKPLTSPALQGPRVSFACTCLGSVSLDVATSPLATAELFEQCLGFLNISQNESLLMVEVFAVDVYQLLLVEVMVCSGQHIGQLFHGNEMYQRLLI